MPYSEPQRTRIAEQSQRTIIESSVADTDRPDYECKSHEDQWALAQVVRDVNAGTAHMRTRGETYLPKLKRETDKEYQTRVGKAKLFNGVRRTNDGLTGMVFRKDPVLVDVPTKILEHTPNIDNAGRDLPVFAKDVFSAGGLDGLSFIYVDYPQVSERRSKEDIKRENIRPFWIHVELENLINWQWEIVKSAPVLRLAVLKESETQAAGEFGQEAVTQYRVVRNDELGTRFELWQEDTSANKRQWTMVDWGPISLDYIPLFPFYARRKDYFEGEPPLLDLAHENVGHWELSSEREKSRTIALIPFLFMKGFPDDEELEVSEDQAFRAEDPEADMKWIVYEGQALAESRQDLQDIEARMAAMGLSLLMPRPSPQTNDQKSTATGDLLRKGEADSALGTASRALEKCMNNALQAHADFLDLGEGGTVTVNQDFHSQQLDPTTLEKLSNMVASGQLSLETLWDIMVAGEVLPEEFDSDLEHERIGSAGLPELDEAA